VNTATFFLYKTLDGARAVVLTQFGSNQNVTTYRCWPALY